MAASTQRVAHAGIHPVHGFLLSAMVPLFLGALLSDWAYHSTYQVQWINFASWLVAGAMVFAGLALLWSIIDNLRKDSGLGWSKWLLVGLLAATFVLGFINALVHAKDAWATMPEGLILSIIVFLLAAASAWIGFSYRRTGEPR